LFCLAVLGSKVAASSGLCLPPAPPDVPQNDALLKEYADLIEQDFQDYFDALTDYSICHDQIFARTLQEAREVSAVYHSFLERAAAAGAVIVPRHAPGSSPSIQRPETGHHDSR
jgi:hypothetical protein